MAYLNGKKIALNPKFLGIANLKPLYDVLGLEPTIEGESVIIEELTNLVEGINSLGIANLKKKLSEVADELTTVEIMSLIDNIETPIELDHTIAFMVGDEPYEIVSVKAGNSVNAPATQPNNNGNIVNRWSVNGDEIVFPYTPTTDVIIDGIISTHEDMLYEFYGVSKTEYPYVVIEWHYTEGSGWNSGYNIYIYFSKAYQENGSALVVNKGYKKGSGSFTYDSDLPDKSVSTIVSTTIEKTPEITTTNASGGVQLMCASGYYYVTNIPLTSTEYQSTMLQI